MMTDQPTTHAARRDSYNAALGHVIDRLRALSQGGEI